MYLEMEFSMNREILRKVKDLVRMLDVEITNAMLWNILQTH